MRRYMVVGLAVLTCLWVCAARSAAQDEAARPETPVNWGEEVFKARGKANNIMASPGQDRVPRATALFDAIIGNEKAPAQYRVEALLFAAELCEHFESPEKAAAYCAEAEKLAAKIESATVRGTALIRLATTCDALGDPVRALRVIADAEKCLAGSAQNAQLLESCKLLTASALCRQGEAVRALELWEQAASGREKPTDLGSVGARIFQYMAKDGKLGGATKLLRKYADIWSAPQFVKAVPALVQSGEEAIRQKKYDDAAAWGRVTSCFIGQGACNLESALRAQETVVNGLLSLQKYDEALVEAKRYFMACPIEKAKGTDAVLLVAQCLKAADGDFNRRARRFLDYQRFGPAGKDGKAGTADDLTDALASVTVLVHPEHELLDKLMDSLPANDHIGRGYSYLLRGDAKAGLAEMRAAYATASGSTLTEPIYAVATALRALDGHTARVNQYLLYQKHGPAGEDGKLWSQDDLEDPLKDVAVGLPAERVAALDAEMGKCGSDYQGLRRRAYMELSCGRSGDGLKTMLEAYRLSPMDGKAMQQAIADVAAAIKAVDGHVFRANQYLLYQKHGPDGPDGKPGTADDMKNPLEAGTATAAKTVEKPKME